MIVSEEQVRNVMKLQHQLIAENRQASNKPETKAEIMRLSSPASELKLVKVSLSNAPEVRKDKVAALKEHIAQGKYQPTGTHIASKMINRSLVDNTLAQVDFE